MKTTSLDYLFAVALAFFVFTIGIHNIKACQLSIPESYVQTFLTPPVSGHYMKCEEKPEEKCFCVDEVDPWTADLADNVVLDYIAKSNEIACTDELDCDAKFIELSCSLDEEKIKNYDLLSVYCAKPIYKIEGKKLAESASKKAVYEASLQAIKDAEELAISNKEALKLSCKEAIKTADTLEKLRSFYEKCFEVK